MVGHPAAIVALETNGLNSLQHQIHGFHNLIFLKMMTSIGLFSDDQAVVH